MKLLRSLSAYQAGLLLVAGLNCPARGLDNADLYGPVNWLKEMPTPFGVASKPAGDARLPEAGAPIAISSPQSSRRLRSLTERLMQPHLYLPGHIYIGSPAEFTIKGRPGSYVALAMADKDSGARPIYDHPLRLGPDRKLVSVGQIPADGILHLVIETPIEGDLIGQDLFFEAAVWSRPDFSDLEIASPVTSEGQVGVKNGVMVAAEPEQKKGLRVVPQTSLPAQVLNSEDALESGKP